MKAAFVTYSDGPKVRIEDVPIPKPNADEVLIRVVVSGSNPKDWKMPMWTGDKKHQGDDITGVVHEVGANVVEFKPGDRVAAFHEIGSANGAYAEYAIAWQHTTFHIPAKTSFEEAATIPLAAMTALVGLYQQLELPPPWLPAKESIPLVIYGAASAVGAYAVQFAVRINIHPLICVAGKPSAHVEAMIDRGRGDTIVDYREGDAAVVAGIKKAVPAGAKLLHAFEAVTEGTSFFNAANALSNPGDANKTETETKAKAKLALVLLTGDEDKARFPAYVEPLLTAVPSVHRTHEDFGHVCFRYLPRALRQGWFRPQPHVVIPGGLGGIQQALEDLHANKANAIKYVFRIADTEGGTAREGKVGE